MNNSDQSLRRLLRAAGMYRPPVAAAEEPPFGFTTRVVAGWLDSSANERSSVEARLQAMWFRRALMCSMALMLVSVGWSYKSDTTASNEEMAIASYDSTADLP